jgi:ABC-type nitrate/sulfonate/bicarbonate transport system permease component
MRTRDPAQPPTPAEGTGATGASRPHWTDRAAGVWAIRAVTLLVILGVWELYGRASDPALFAPPSEVVKAFKEVAIDEATLWHAAWDSIRVLAIGFVAAAVVGILVGLIMGWFRFVEYVLDPYVSFLYALPMAVIVPLLIIWVGIGVEARIAVVFAITVIPILLNTVAGVKEVSEDLVDVARNYGAGNRELLRTVVFPSVLPYVFAGLNVGIGTAIIGMILGEFLVVIQGLGGLVVEYSNSFQPDKVFVPLLVLITLSISLTSGLRWARRRLMPWAPRLDGRDL